MSAHHPFLPSGSVFRAAAALGGPGAPTAAPGLARSGPGALTAAPGLAPQSPVPPTGAAAGGGRATLAPDGPPPPGAQSGEEAAGDDGHGSFSGARATRAPDGPPPPGAQGSEKAAGDDGHGSIGVHLRALGALDPERILLARRINGLGHSSEGLLALHYSAFGEVTGVHVPRSKVRTSKREHAEGQCRVRPGGMGFIVMSDPRSAGLILQQGREQTVAGKRITLEPFHDRGAGPRPRALRLGPPCGVERLAA